MTAQAGGRRIEAGEVLRRYGILIAFAVLCVVLAIVNDSLLSGRNVFDVLRQASISGILAIGMTFVILA